MELSIIGDISQLYLPAAKIKTTTTITTTVMVVVVIVMRAHTLIGRQGAILSSVMLHWLYGT